MFYVVFRLLKRRKTWTVAALLSLVVWFVIARFHNENDVDYFNRNGEEISFPTSVKFWLKGDLESGITLVNVKNPKVIPSHHRSSMPSIADVTRDIHRYDADLELLFHEAVDGRAMVALFWNKDTRTALVFAFPESNIYGEHESSDPDLSKSLTAYDVEFEINTQTYFYEPDEGVSSFLKQESKSNQSVNGASLITLAPKHGPIESWGFGTELNADQNAKLTFFIGYDKSQRQWQSYELRVQHADTKGRRDWQMQEFDLR